MTNIFPHVVFHHHPCADGFAAALAVFLKYGTLPSYRPANYGKSLDFDGIDGKNVYFVDFFPSLDQLEFACAHAANVVVLDHHKTALETYNLLQTNPPAWAANLTTKFDMERSGAGITWDWFHTPSERRPHLISHVQDRDLWQFKRPGTRAVAEYLFSLDYDFKQWSDAFYDMERGDNYARIVAAGEALVRKKFKDIREYAAHGLQWWWFVGPTGGDTSPLQVRTSPQAKASDDALGVGWRVPVLNIPYTHGSDAADVVLKELHPEAPFFAYYMDKQDHRQWGLRSRGEFDVSAVAKARGGGGHKNAAGFEERWR